MIRAVLACMLCLSVTRVGAGEIDCSRTGPMPLDPAPAKERPALTAALEALPE